MQICRRHIGIYRPLDERFYNWHAISTIFTTNVEQGADMLHLDASRKLGFTEPKNQTFDCMIVISLLEAIMQASNGKSSRSS